MITLQSAELPSSLFVRLVGMVLRNFHRAFHRAGPWSLRHDDHGGFHDFIPTVAFFVIMALAREGASLGWCGP
jgi:hypothetical protein